MKIGVISDTHGRTHPRVFELFNGVDHIIHAGDIGEEECLIDLRALAPVTVVRGNVDVFGPCSRYPEEAAFTLGNVRFHLVHQVMPLLDRIDQQRWQGPLPDVLIYGHSHQGTMKTVGKTMLFNPGSAGPRRFKKIPSIGLMAVTDGTVSAQLIALEPEEQDALEG